MDEESYEKSLLMYVVIGEPRQIAGRLNMQIKTFDTLETLIFNIYIFFIICRGKGRR